MLCPSIAGLGPGCGCGARAGRLERSVRGCPVATCGTDEATKTRFRKSVSSPACRPGPSISSEMAILIAAATSVRGSANSGTRARTLSRGTVASPSASLSALNTGTVQQRHCCISPSSRNQGQDCCSFVQRSAVLLTQPEWSLPNERPRARFFWSTVGSCVGADSSSGRHRSKSGCDCPAEVVRT